MDPFDRYQTNTGKDACSVFLSSYGVLGAKARVVCAEQPRVKLAFDRWEFPSLDVGSTVTLSFVFSNSGGSVLYSLATVQARSARSDLVMFDVEIDPDDSAAQVALRKLEGMIDDDFHSVQMSAAEH